MCGILALLRLEKGQAAEMRQTVVELSKLQRHRGPDWSGVHVTQSAVLAHERLGIMDPESGNQPLISPDGKIALTVNGEIYNHAELREDLQKEYSFKVGFATLLLVFFFLIFFLMIHQVLWTCVVVLYRLAATARSSCPCT